MSDQDSYDRDARLTVTLPDGRVVTLPKWDYLRLESLAHLEDLTVGEWFAKHLENLESRKSRS